MYFPIRVSMRVTADDLPDGYLGLKYANYKVEMKPNESLQEFYERVEICISEVIDEVQGNCEYLGKQWAKGS